jgi:RNA polymerase sigma-70 factor (ECF subfamily)
MKTPVPDPAPAAVFATTHWSIVLAAGSAPSRESEAALENLCRSYWYPLYAYLRRRGSGPQDAQDLVQEFFYHLLRSDWLSRADRNKGRFRTFLLCGLQNFSANEWQKANRLKRGSGHSFISLDQQGSEARYSLEPTDVASPDFLFDRRWAMTVLQVVLGKLEAEQAASGSGERFKELQPVLVGEPNNEGYAAMAERFGVSESTVKSWARRLRLRYRELLRAEVAQTVADSSEVDTELRYLLRVLSTPKQTFDGTAVREGNSCNRARETQ